MSLFDAAKATLAEISGMRISFVKSYTLLSYFTDIFLPLSSKINSVFPAFSTRLSSPKWILIHAMLLYIAPVSIYVREYFSAIILHTELLPLPAGPSIATCII